MNKKINDYKAVIINGVNNKGDINGNVDYVGNLDEYGFHIDALIEYALEKYPDVQVFSKIPSNCEFDVPIFFLTWLNNIVYVNVSDVKHGKKGIVFFPDEVSLKQKEALYDLMLMLQLFIIWILMMDLFIVMNLTVKEECLLKKF